MSAVSWDNRTFIDRMKRRPLWQLCDEHNINYRPGASAMECRELLKHHGVTDVEAIQFMEKRDRVQVVEGMDEHGQNHREFIPVSEPHESARQIASGKQIDYERIIEERTEENKKQESVIDDQKTVIEALMERLTALESTQLPLSSMTPPQLKQVAKMRGIDVKGLKTKKELLAVLEG